MSEYNLDDLFKAVAEQGKIELPTPKPRAQGSSQGRRRPRAPGSPCVTKQIGDLSEEDQKRINGYKPKKLDIVPTYSVKINLSHIRTEFQKKLLIGQNVWSLAKYGINVTVLYDEITETVTLLYKEEISDEVMTKIIDYQMMFPAEDKE